MRPIRAWRGPSAAREPALKTKKETIITSKLFVGNLNFKTQPYELEELFSEAGDVVEVILPTDRNTGRPRGFAFVEFSSPDDAADAIEKFDGHEFAGRQLRVNEAESRPPRRPSFNNGPPFGGGGGRGGGGGHARPARPKGSRRNLRGKKRRL